MEQVRKLFVENTPKKGFNVVNIARLIEKEVAKKGINITVDPKSGDVTYDDAASYEQRDEAWQSVSDLVAELHQDFEY